MKMDYYCDNCHKLVFDYNHEYIKCPFNHIIDSFITSTYCRNCQKYQKCQEYDNIIKVKISNNVGPIENCIECSKIEKIRIKELNKMEYIKEQNAIELNKRNKQKEIDDERHEIINSGFFVLKAFYNKPELFKCIFPDNSNKQIHKILLKCKTEDIYTKCSLLNIHKEQKSYTETYCDCHCDYPCEDIYYYDVDRIGLNIPESYKHSKYKDLVQNNFFEYLKNNLYEYGVS